MKAARQQAIDFYSKIIDVIRKDGNVGGKTYKSTHGADTTSQSTYICLQCSNVSSNRERHRKDHPFCTHIPSPANACDRSMLTCHPAVESNLGFVYCHDCRDFVYDPTFEEIRTGHATKKRKHVNLSSDDRRLMSSNAASTPCAATGLRGIYNMGQTCFMSVILQSLIHNPLIRSFYLSEGHKSSGCDRDACTSCALDDIFTKFFEEEKHEGYGAVPMLQGCWKGGGGLAGYSQQDAHEYLGFILNSLHTAITDEDDDGGMKKKDSNDCECVIHQTFGGLYKSTVTCSSCKNFNSTLDPFMDLSLDIRVSPVGKKKKLPITNSVQTVIEFPPMDLTECLDRFTSTETLGSDSEYKCRKCDSSEGAKKKLSLSRLPPVVSIHLKRFSHSRTLKESTKVDTRIRFPFVLDLKPYLSRSVRKAASNGTKTVDEDSKNAESPADYGLSNPVYDLSSVVVHKGKIDNGHYISYAKQGPDWFRFDDSMVVQVDEKEVLRAEAYMLFYVAKEFDVPV